MLNKIKKPQHRYQTEAIILLLWEIFLEKPKKQLISFSEDIVTEVLKNI